MSILCNEIFSPLVLAGSGAADPRTRKSQDRQAETPGGTCPLSFIAGHAS